MYDCGLLALAIAASVAWLWGLVGLGPEGTPRLSVRQDDRVLYAAPLVLPHNERVMTIRVPKGYDGPFELKLVFSDKGVRIAPLPRHNCPDGVCWGSGPIDSKGEAVICVPNRISVGITGGGAGADGVDAVAK